MKKLHVLCKSRMVFRVFFSRSDVADEEIPSPTKLRSSLHRFHEHESFKKSSD